MANDIPNNLKYTRIGVEGPVEVNGHLVGSSVFDSLRRAFTIDSQMDQGDYFMNQSTDLLEKHIQLILLNDQTAIRKHFTKARDLKHELYSDDYNGSPFRRFFEARQYRRLSRKAYKTVKFASDRVREDPLVDQLAKATQPHGGQPGSGPGTASSTRDPFTDSHAVSTLSEGNVNDDRDEVEMLTYREGATNGRDGSDRDVAFAGDRTEDTGASQPTASAPAALSLHQEDGSSSRFIAAVPLPDPPDETAEEQVETSTLYSLAISELMTSEANSPDKVMRATACPVDSDTYTCSLPSGSGRL